jgi:hypothetical protein
MSNSKKLQDDAARHRGFEKAIKDAVHPMNVIGVDYSKTPHDRTVYVKMSQPIEFIEVNINISDIGKSCPHKETVKKYVLTSHYFVCKACGEEI